MSRIQERLSAIQQTKYMQMLLHWMNSRFFPIAYALLMLLSSFFGLEILVYIITTILVVIICLFDDDTKPMIALACLVVYSTSWKNTPQPPYNSQFFYSIGTLSVIAVCACIVFVSMAFRYIVSFRNPENNKAVSCLKIGLLLLAGSFILNGSLYKQNSPKDLLLGSVVAFSFVALYLFFTKTLNKGQNFSLYFANVLFAASVVIILQIVKLLVFGHNTSNGRLSVFLSDGSISKDLMITGWGMSNNLGGMLAMFLPAELFLAYKSRFGKIFYVFAIVQFITIAFTLSRSSLLVGGIILLTGAIILSIVKNRDRTFIRIINIVGLIGCVCVAVIFIDKIQDIFSVIFDRGFSDSNRFQIWKNGLDNFLSAPLFGVGFYAPFHVDVNIENWLFPDMYHNILIQIAASCGLFGLFAYTLHLSQISVMLFRKQNAENLLCFALFAAISGASLLDNHLFHIFPALVYSVALAIWEMNIKNESNYFQFGKRIKMLNGKSY